MVIPVTLLKLSSQSTLVEQNSYKKFSALKGNVLSTRVASLATSYRIVKSIKPSGVQSSSPFITPGTNALPIISQAGKSDSPGLLHTLPVDPSITGIEQPGRTNSASPACNFHRLKPIQLFSVVNHETLLRSPRTSSCGALGLVSCAGVPCEKKSRILEPHSSRSSVASISSRTRQC